MIKKAPRANCKPFPEQHLINFFLLLKLACWLLFAATTDNTTLGFVTYTTKRPHHIVRQYISRILFIN